jgi:hypothetical protein
MRYILNMATTTSAILISYYLDITMSILIDLPLIGFSYWFNDAPTKLIRRQTDNGVLGKSMIIYPCRLILA